MVVDVRAVNRELRASLWPALLRHGFDVHTDRAGWRYWEGGIDVLEVSSIGAQADACGCTTYSFGARIGSIPQFMGEPPPWSMARDGRPRPHYWDCQLMLGLRKTLSQPWFRPFSAAPRTSLPRSMRLHREGLMRALRRDVHDRADIWFVLDDGSNLSEVINDLVLVVEGEGLRTLGRFHDPCSVIAMVEAGDLAPRPASPAALDIIHKARRLCPDA
jgi:hypothetical protein